MCGDGKESYRDTSAKPKVPAEPEPMAAEELYLLKQQYINDNLRKKSILKPG